MKRFINTFYALLLILFFANPVMAKDVKFIQVTDLKLMPDDASINNYLRAIDKINHTKDLDFVVFTGDNIGGPNEDLLKLFIYLTMKIKVPYYIEIGDKDCFKSAGLDKKTYLKYVNGYKIFNRKKSFNYIVKDGKYIYIFADGVKEHIPSKNGYYRETTVNWIDKVLTKNKNKTAIIFQHFPLFDLSENSVNNLYRADLYTDMLKKHNNVLAIFAGHYLYSIERKSEEGDVYYFVTEPAQNGYSSYREVNIVDVGHSDYEIYSQIINF